MYIYIYTHVYIYIYIYIVYFRLGGPVHVPVVPVELVVAPWPEGGNEIIKSLKLCIYIYICIHTPICVYTYIYREREI